MEDKKKEELKKILENSMNTDHFEKHRSESEENVTTEETKDYNDIKMDSLSNKQKQNNNKSLLLPFFILLSILLFTAIIFLFNRQNEILSSLQSQNMKKELLVEKKIIKQEEIKKEVKKETFVKKEKEPNTIKIEELKKAAHKKEEIKKTLDKNESNDFKKVVKKNYIVDTETTKKEDITKNIEKEVSKEEEKAVIKEIKIIDKNLTKAKFREYYNGSKFNKLTCYDYNAGAIFPTNKCKTEMKDFLEKNKTALRVEVIAVIAQDDIEIFEGIENTKLAKYSTPARLKKYAIRGLARDRVLESTWYVKETLGNNAVITPTNYFVTSKKNNKGILIKAYH